LFASACLQGVFVILVQADASDSKVASEEVQRLKDENTTLVEAKMENERKMLEIKTEVW
jgi:hypothetical protein